MISPYIDVVLEREVRLRKERQMSKEFLIMEISRVDIVDRHGIVICVPREDKKKGERLAVHESHIIDGERLKYGIPEPLDIILAADTPFSIRQAGYGYTHESKRLILPRPKSESPPNWYTKLDSLLAKGDICDPLLSQLVEHFKKFKAGENKNV